MPDATTPSPERRDRRRALATGLAVVALVLAVPLLAQGYRELRRHQGVDQVALQFAGGREAACQVIQPGAAGCPVPAAEVERYTSAVRADWYLVAGYVLAGLGVFGLGGLFLYGSGAQRIARCAPPLPDPLLHRRQRRRAAVRHHPGRGHHPGL